MDYEDSIKTKDEEINRLRVNARGQDHDSRGELAAAQRTIFQLKKQTDSMLNDKKEHEKKIKDFELIVSQKDEENKQVTYIYKQKNELLNKQIEVLLHLNN